MRVTLLSLLGLGCAGKVDAGWFKAGVEPVSLRCEYRDNPLGIDVAKPRLSWRLETGSSFAKASEDKNSEPERGIKQTAFQVLVASSTELLKNDKGDLWDSGQVESDQSVNVEYKGKPLASRQSCFWKVRIWFTVHGSAVQGSEWSRTAEWSMGLLKPEDFKAKWIGVKQAVPATAGRTPLGSGPLRIVSASYQAVSGAAASDVTGRLASRVQDNMLLIVASNDELGGDPAYGIEKKLVVEYELAGWRGTMTVAENERVAINLDVQRDEEARWPKPRYLRKGFTLDGAVRRATVYATALGLYELRLNGQRVGDHLLAPEWTDYHTRVQYQTHDVTALLRSGANAIGATLGNGWYCGGWQYWEKNIRAMYGTEPSLWVQLEVEFADGRREMVVTDDSWRGTTDGPLRFTGIYEGATYDARKEMPGWDAPGFDDSKWLALQPRGADLRVGKLVWPRGQPIRATRELKPVSVTEVKPGVHVFAFDQNMVGHCRVKFRGKAGGTVELQHGEMRNPDGTVFLGNLLVVSHHRIQLDRYTFRSNAEETFEPAFTYHGFQYVEVRGLKEKPALDSVVGVVVNSDCPETGEFTCSDPLLNRLAQNILWSQRGNYMGVPTDCPQRNERCGYTGDAEFFMRAAVYNMDVSAFFNKWLVDVCEDAQMPDGHIADRAPHYGTGDSWYIGWGDAGIICPYEIYRTYGDIRVIREHYSAMKRYLEAMNRNSKDGLFTGNIGGGDWLATGGGVADDVMGTAYLALDFKLMAEMAEAIGETRDAAAFRERFDEVAKAFAKAYIDAEGNIKESSQSGYALAFTIGLVPPALKEKMTAHFTQEVRRFDWHPRTGFVGTPRLLPGLHLAGRDEDAYKLILTKTAPSWLYPVSVGATTIWEQWEAWDGKNAKGGMNSLNHYAFGSVGEYVFGMIGGIQPEAPGYKRIRIQPVIGDGLTWANTSYESIRGKIVSNWKREGQKLTIEVTIPPNSTAAVYVPTKDEAGVTESKTSAAKSEGVKFLRLEGHSAVYAVGSGTYLFESALPEANTEQGEKQMKKVPTTQVAVPSATIQGAPVRAEGPDAAAGNAAFTARANELASDILRRLHVTNAPPITTDAIGTFYAAKEIYDAGRYEECRRILDAFWKRYPMESTAWKPIAWTDEAHILGHPHGHAALQMLTECCRARTSPDWYKYPPVPLQWTVVLMGKLVTTNGTTRLDERLVANDKRRLRRSMPLFLEYVKAMTKGRIEVQPRIVYLPDYAVPVTGADANGERGLDCEKVAADVPKEVRDTTDWWWMIYPLRPTCLIGGGMGGANGGPCFLCEDGWAVGFDIAGHPDRLREDEEYDLYFSQWLQHEFYHFVFALYPEFELEKKDHQWFDLSTWPADFAAGQFESDYYSEALHKRIQARAAVPLHVKFKPKGKWKAAGSGMKK